MADLTKKISDLSSLQLAYTAARLREELRDVEALRSEPVAVVGMACRFPGGATSPEAYWRLLEAGRDVLSTTPADRWDHHKYFSSDAEKPGHLYSTRAGYLQGDVFAFDYEFFGISPLEARAMDPQQRLLLEIAWHALEDAGLPVASLKDTLTGVFMGIGLADYAKNELRSPARESITPYSLTGSQFSVAAGRLSYFLGLRGPSLALDTACSSSLAAVHLAVRSLRSGECNAALAGGVNLILSPEADIALSRAGVLSPTGACRSFDAGADGYARGEGCGVFVLKRLADAVREGDRVLAVIRGSAMNHDGSAAGLTVPSAAAQTQLIQAALADSGVAPEQVTYLEAHGTGTPLGDPLEAKAAARALTGNRASDAPLLLGTAKATIGHLETAAGAAGLMKVVLSLLHRRLPPQAGFIEPNPRINWQADQLRVEARGRDWSGNERRIAGVSSFGIGGTNVHILVEEGPDLSSDTAEASIKQEQGPILLPVSAHNKTALQQRVRDLKDFIQAPQAQTSAETRRLARHLANRGNHGEQRLACVGNSGSEILTRLEAYLEEREAPGLVADQVRFGDKAPVFVFTGQSPGRSFTLAPKDIREPAFQSSLEQCDSICRTTAGWSIIEFLRNPGDNENRTEFVQPALFALQISLAAWWREQGVEPGAVLGHSAGEIAAAHVAGALDLKDALTLSVNRGRRMQSVQGRGGMLAAAMTVSDARELSWIREGRLVIAVRNSPQSLVFSGQNDAIDELREYARTRNIFAKKLAAAYAFHHPMMDAVSRELDSCLSGLQFNAVRVPYFSAVTGERLREPLDADYFRRQITAPVLFAEAVKSIPVDNNTFLELSPRATLAGHLADGRPDALIAGSLLRDMDHGTALYYNLGVLYAGGFKTPWDKIYPGHTEHVAVPLYPWTRTHLRSQANLGVPDAIVPNTPTDNTSAEIPAPRGPKKDQAFFISLLSREVRKLLGTPADTILDPDRGFFQMGMDSMTAVGLARALSHETGRNHPRSLIFQHGNIRGLAQFLAETHVEPEPETKAPARMTGEDFAHFAQEPVAIIGMGCRFPGGADTPEKFWEMLRDGIEAVDEFPVDRLDLETFHDPRPGTPGKVITRRAALLDQVDRFDADFFGISPREAMAMDPQQRILLETTWEALERAGQVIGNLRESATGVFIGMTTNDYYHLQAAGGDLDSTTAYTASGTLHSVAAGRISYVLGLRGPSLAVDTACSSALTAVHLACESLRRGESEMALAGGVNLILSPESTVSMSMLRALSPRGRCSTFDASADGYVRGEGCGMIVLKTLSAARRDGDQILALIRADKINHDGPAGGLTVPSGSAQQSLLRETLESANIAPHEIDYVEAHGTGTPLGDPIEFNSIAEVYGNDPLRRAPLLVGSVKTNVGHLESAAGMAGLFKTVLSLQNKAVPPHLHLRELNPDIEPEKIPARIPGELTEWKRGNGPRMAALNSFGMSGTNAHLVFQEAEPTRTSENEEPRTTIPVLLPLSARSEPALRALAGDVRDSLRDAQESIPPALPYSAAMHRDHHEYRLTATAHNTAELSTMLDAFSQGRESAGLSHGRAAPNRRPIFVFSGQGSQWAGMGLELMEQNKIFRTGLEQCHELIQELEGWSLFDALNQKDPDYLRRVEINQPVLFALQFSLAETWRGRGIEPEAVMGQSMGEVAAAACAGALSLRDAARVITLRSRLLSRNRDRGAMLLLHGRPDIVAELTQGQGTEIAMELSPEASIASGPVNEIQLVETAAGKRGIMTRRLRVMNAGHTPAMDEFKRELLEGLKDIRPRTGELPIYSTTDTTRLTGEQLGADYWWRNLRNPVGFLQMTKDALSDDFNLFVEISPHPVVVSSLTETFEALDDRHARAIPSLRRDESETQSMELSAGRIYCSGYLKDVEAHFSTPKNSAPRIALPTYPWQRKSYWLSGDTLNSPRKGYYSPLGPGLEPVLSPGLIAHVINLDLNRLSYLNDHRVLGTPVLPASMYIELAAAAFIQQHDGDPLRLERVEFLAPFPLDKSDRELQLSLHPWENEYRKFEFHGREQGQLEWTLHAQGHIRSESAENESWQVQDWSEPAFPADKGFRPDEFYGALARIGMEYGPAFQGIESLAFARASSNVNLVHAAIHTPEEIARNSGVSVIHPAFLDACLHSQAALVSSREDLEAVLPTSIESITLRRFTVSDERVLVRATGEEADSGKTLKGDVIARTPHGETAFIVRGLTSRLMPRDTDAELDSWTYDLHWRRVEAKGHSPLDEGDWVIWSDDQLGTACADKIIARGGRVLMVRSADKASGKASDKGPQPVSSEFYRTEIYIDLNSAADASALRRAVNEFGPAGMLHLQALEHGPGADVQGSLAMCRGLQLLLTTPDDSERMPVLIVTAGAEQTSREDELTDPLGAAVRGMGRVARNEFVNLDCRLIDMPGDEQRIDLLFRAAACDESEIAVRNAACLAPRMRRVPFVEQAPRESWSVSEPGTILITGGLGGLGLRTAEFLSGAGVSHIVLAGRSQPAPEALETIEVLLARGTSVRILKADITDGDQALRLIEQAELDAPPLMGVLHLAGVLRDGLIRSMKAEDFQAVMEPKIRGTLNLAAALEDRPLKFLIFFSSAVTMLGTPGQGNYAAANGFLDAFARTMAAKGQRTLSIGWGPFAETGLAAKDAQTNRRLAGRGMDAIPGKTGMRALERFLKAMEQKQGPVQVALMPFRVDTWCENHPLAASSSYLRELAERRESAPDYFRALLERRHTRTEQEDLLMEHLREQAALVLRMEPGQITPDRTFGSLGFDSLTTLEIRNRLNASLGLTLPAAVLWNYPTPAKLLQFLMETLGLGENNPERNIDRQEVPAHNPVDEDLEDLTTEELAELLRAELDGHAHSSYADRTAR